MHYFFNHLVSKPVTPVLRGSLLFWRHFLQKRTVSTFCPQCLPLFTHQHWLIQEEWRALTKQSKSHFLLNYSPEAGVEGKGKNSRRDVGTGQAAQVKASPALVSDYPYLCIPSMRSSIPGPSLLTMGKPYISFLWGALFLLPSTYVVLGSNPRNKEKKSGERIICCFKETERATRCIIF